jgi:hypothetical protein
VIAVTLASQEVPVAAGASESRFAEGDLARASSQSHVCAYWKSYRVLLVSDKLEISNKAIILRPPNRAVNPGILKTITTPDLAQAQDYLETGSQTIKRLQG